MKRDSFGDNDDFYVVIQEGKGGGDGEERIFLRKNLDVELVGFRG